MNTSCLLNGEDVANRLGICLSLAYRLMRNGQLPAVRFGRVVRVREEDIEAFILRNLHEDNSKPLLMIQSRKSNVKQ
jgi:excisionase family DNA binding protein